MVTKKTGLFRALGYILLMGLSSCVYSLRNREVAAREQMIAKGIAFDAATYLAAVSNRNTEVLSLFRDAGVGRSYPVDAIDRFGTSHLSWAIGMGRSDLVEQELKIHGLPGCPTYGCCRMSPLAYACGWSNLDIVKLLVEYGASVNEVVSNAVSPKAAAKTGIHWIVEGLLCHVSDVAVAKYLLSQGAAVNVGSVPPVCHAAAYGNADLVELLLQYGADRHATNIYHVVANWDNAVRDPEYTALIAASALGNEGVVDVLLRDGSSCRNEEGDRALLAAVRNRRSLEIVDKLLSRGASPEYTDHEGTSCWKLATEWRDEQLLELFRRSRTQADSDTKPSGCHRDGVPQERP